MANRSGMRGRRGTPKPRTAAGYLFNDEPRVISVLVNNAGTEKVEGAIEAIADLVADADATGIALIARNAPKLRAAAANLAKLATAASKVEEAVEKAAKANA